MATKPKMSARLQEYSRRVFDAYIEGRVGAVITLIEEGFIKYNESKLSTITYILSNVFKMSSDEINYWVDYFKVKE